MSEALEKMMYIGVYTAIFLTAIAFAVVMVRNGYDREAAVNKAMQKKSSVTVVDIEKENTAYVTQSASSVIASVIDNIKAMTDEEILAASITYDIDSFVLSPEQMYRIKRGEPEYIKFLKNLVLNCENYRVIYTYNDDLLTTGYKYIGE